MKNIFPFLFILFAFQLTNCKYDYVTPYEAPSFSANCTVDSIYFAQMVMPILQKSCATSGCHDAFSKAAKVDLSNHYAIIQNLRPGSVNSSKLYEVIDHNTMPPPSANQLTEREKSIISKWIAQGAHNNSCSALADCDTSNITYVGYIQSKLNICKSCHVAGNNQGGIDLSTYIKVKKYVDNGTLLGTIEHNPKYPPMPKLLKPFDVCAVAKIRAWVNAGAPFN